MLKAIIDLSIARRWLVLTLAGLGALLGLFALLRLPFDAFPDTTPVMVQVNVNAPGWAPDEIERQVTFPVERELSGLTGLTEIRSISKYGLSQVNLIFNDEIDLYLARQQVSERLLSVDLPDGIESPRLGPVSTGLGEIFQYVVVGTTDDPTYARTVQDWLIKPQLQTVPGVAEVNSWGGFEKQFHIVLDPNRLAQYRLSLDAVVERLRESLKNVAGGELVRGGEQTLVQGHGIVTDPREIEELVIDSRQSIPIQVKDIADVVVGHELRRGAATYQGNGEVVLGLGFMITGENSHQVAEQLRQRLGEVRSTLPEGIALSPVYVRTDLVDQVLETVKHNLLFGAALVMAVLFLFLGHLRAGLIVASSIPLSMLFAFDLMERLGIVGSLMSLGAIDFGLAVDNAVIQVENAVRRLEENNNRSRLDIIRDAILEVRTPTLFGELIIILVYLPILTLQGVEGKMFRPMAMTVVLVLLGSLLLSFTVIPALCAAFLPKLKTHVKSRFLGFLEGIYRPTIARALKYRAGVTMAALFLVVIGAVLFMSLGREFVPRLNEGTVAINVIRLAGVAVDQTVADNTNIEKIVLAAFPDEIEHIWGRVGTAELATDPMGLELTDFFMTLKPREEWKRAANQNELVSLIDKELEDLPGMNRVFTQPIEMRVNEMIAGIRADVGIKLFGDDLRVLEEKAEQLSAIVEQIPGAADVSVEQLIGQPQMKLELDRVNLARYGIPAEEALSYIQSLGGIPVGELYDQQQRFDIQIRMDKRYASVPEDVERIPLVSSTGAVVTLDQVTNPTISSGYATITREWGKRRAIVQCNVRDRDVVSFVAELKDRIERELSLPAGYFVRFGGQFENLEQAQQRLSIIVPLALLMIFGLLYLSFKSFRDAAIIFTGVPLAAIGGVLALGLRGMPFSISAAVGFIALSGIAVLNGLVLVSQIRKIRDEGAGLDEAIEQGSTLRLRPVLMTALVAALGFVPMALSSGVGAEVQRPLATVVIGGIVSSTLLTLVVLPALYALFGRGAAGAIEES